MMSRLSQPAQKESLRISPSTSPRRSDIKISGPFPHPFPSKSPSPENGYLNTTNAAASNLYAQSQHSHTSLQPPGRCSPRSFAFPNYSTRNPHTPHSSVSSTVPRGYNMHRRRASTLRTAMKKLFGRIRHSQGELAEDERESDGHGLSRPQWISESDPENDFLPMQGVPEVSTRSRRSFSLPRPESRFSRKSSANDVQKDPLQAASMSLNENHYLHPREERIRHRRRATLPSIVLDADDARELSDKVAQQGAPQVGRLPYTEDQRRIGHRKRNSRSAEELRSIANMHLMSPIQWRRRSEEIRYSRFNWEGVRTLQSISNQETERTAPATTADTEEEATPLEDDIQGTGAFGGPFDFSTLVGTAQDNETSLAHRVGTLEVKLMDLEFAIAKLQGHDISPFQPSGPGDQLLQQQQQQQPAHITPQMQSAPSLQNPSSLLSSLRSSPPIATPPRSSPSADCRPDSVVTIRPQTSSQHSYSPRVLYSPPSNPDFSGISVEQYSALTTLVRREQTARKLLEAQLVEMRKEMQALRNGIQPRRPSSQDSFQTSSTTHWRRGWRDALDVNRASIASRNTAMTGSDQTDFDRKYTPRPRLASDGQRRQVTGMI